MQNGHYQTVNGSRVTVSGRHSGIYEIEFDWVEENACIECRPSVYDGSLVWDCDHCNGGRAMLHQRTGLN